MTVWNLIKKSCKEIYRNLMGVILASIFWFVTAGLLLALDGMILITYWTEGMEVIPLVPILLTAIFIGPATIGPYYMANRLVNYRRVRIRDFFIGAKRYFLKSLLISLIIGIFVIIILVDFRFYLNSSSQILQWLSVFWLYLLFFVGIIVNYVFPLLIELDNLNEDYSILDIFKYSFSLIIKDFWYSVFIFVAIMIYTIICGISAIGVPLLLTGGIAIMANNATINVLVRDGVKKDINGPYDFK